MSERLEKIGHNEISHEKLGITAVGVSYLRTLTNIKYAEDIYKHLNLDLLTPEEKTYMSEVRDSNFAPLVEARYKLVNRLLKESNVKQVLEIASGLSPRGLEFTDEIDFQYTEVDLPPIAQQKGKILAALGARPNLHLETGNALEFGSLLPATKYFNDKSIVVINEGLLRYLNFDQKAIVAKNVHGLLEKFGGYWITPDITLAKVLPNMNEDHRKRIQRVAGIDTSKNVFENLEQARSFFEGLGFKVEIHSFAEIKEELVSPKNTGIPDKEVDEMLQAYVFKMEVV